MQPFSWCSSLVRALDFLNKLFLLGVICSSLHLGSSFNINPVLPSKMMQLHNTYLYISNISAPGTLLAHLQKKHKIEIETQARSSDAERFKCNVCQKIFLRGTRLSDHMNTHTGEKPHKCEHCGQGFASKANKFAHVRAAHLGIKRRSK